MMVILFFTKLEEQWQNIFRDAALLKTLYSMVSHGSSEHGKPPIRVLAIYSPSTLAHRMSHMLDFVYVVRKYETLERNLKTTDDNEAGLSKHQIDLVAEVFNHAALNISPNIIKFGERAE